jgi:hypothetical protein
MLERTARKGHYLDGPTDTTYDTKYMYLKFKCTEDSCDYYEYYKKPLK